MVLPMDFIDGSEPLYVQLAAKLHDQIRRGNPGPGQTLPAEPALSAQHGVGLMTVRRALAVLRDEGLITTQRGTPATVRSNADRRRLTLPPGSRLVCRMPTHEERGMLNMQRGTPLMELRRPDGSVEVMPADAVEVVQPSG